MSTFLKKKLNVIINFLGQNTKTNLFGSTLIDIELEYVRDSVEIVEQ